MMEKLKDIIRNEAKDMIHRTDPYVAEGTREFDAALVMLAALRFGASNLERLSELTGVGLESVREFARNLTKGGVWTDSRAKVEKWGEPGGETAFWCDVNVAAGGGLSGDVSW